MLDIRKRRKGKEKHRHVRWNKDIINNYVKEIILTLASFILAYKNTEFLFNILNIFNSSFIYCAFCLTFHSQTTFTGIIWLFEYLQYQDISCCTVFLFQSFQMVHRVLIVTNFVLHIINKPVQIVFYIPC